MLIVPGVARFSVNGEAGGRPIVNVLDIRIDTTGSLMTRAEAVEAQAGVLINEWSDSILGMLCSNYVVNSVSWVDLDDADGTTGERSTTSQETWPQNGTVATAPLPSNVSALFTKQTVSQRGIRRGRMYLAPVPEAITTDNSNEINAITRGDWQAAISAFLGDVNQENGVAGYDSKICVVHITGRDGAGNPVTGVSNDVSSFAIQTTLATQRRRLRG